MKKFLIMLFVVLSMGTAFAGPNHHHGGHRGPGCPPPPPRYCGRYYGGYYYRNDGVRLAADIVGLVGAGLSILNPRPVIVTTPVQTVVQQPIIVEQPKTTWIKVIGPDGREYYQKVVQRPYYSQPPPRIIYY